MGCGRGLGDEAIHAVGQEFDLLLLRVNLLLGRLIQAEKEKEVCKILIKTWEISLFQTRSK